MFYKCECKPLHDYVLVRTIDHPNKVTPSGLIIPDTAEKQPVCQVVGKGPGREDVKSSIPNDINVGDLVILQKYIGTKVEMNGKVYMMVKYYDIQALISFYDKDGNKFTPDIPDDFFVKDI